MADEHFRSTDCYKIHPIYRKRNSVMNALLGSKVCMSIIGDHLDETIPVFSPIYADKLGVDRALTEQTLLALLKGINDGYPTTADYRNAAWVMAANREHMLDGNPLEPFRSVVQKEWVPVTVLDGYRGLKTRFRTMGTYFKLKCTGGTPVTHEFTTFFTPSRGKKFLYYHMFQLHKNYKRFEKIKDLCEFVGMSSWILLDPDKCQGRSIWFEYVAMSDELRKANLELVNFRQGGCINDPPFDWPCRKCYKGIEDCGLSMHRTTYTRRFCEKCSNDEAHFKPDDEGNVCLHCRESARLARDHEKLEELMEKENKDAVQG